MTISQIFTTPPTDRREPAEQNCFELLEKLHIPFERVEHDPAFTMEDCRAVKWPVRFIRMAMRVFAPLM